MRFPEFDGEWEEKRLGEVTKKVNSGKTPLGGEAVYTKEGIIFIRSQNVNNDELELKNSVFIPDFVHDQMKNSIVQPKDILLNITGASLGRSCVVPNNFECGNVNQHVCIIRLHKQYCPSFIQPIFSSNKGQAVFTDLQTGSGREGLNFESIKGIKICIPSLPEQEKTASFLSLINKRIETQRKIIKDLELLKECISAGLFNRTLYSDITSDWEIVKLSEALSVPNKIKPKFIDKDKLLTVRLHLNGVIKNESTDTLSLGATNYYIRRKGQFIFGKQNIFNGAFGIIPDELDNHLSSGDVPTLDIDTSKISGLFLLYYFSREEFYKPMENLAIGSGSKRIHEATILNLKIALPTLEEQSSISKKIFILEQKINLEKKILESMQKMKKYLLKNLFI